MLDIEFTYLTIGLTLSSVSESVSVCLE